MNWNAIKSLSTPNLNVLSIAGKEVGFIHKPKDSKTDKNAWRAYRGIGEGNQFIGHAWDKAGAKKLVENACKK